MGNYNSKYFDKKEGSLEEAIRMAVNEKKLDPVNPKALKKYILPLSIVNDIS